VDRTHGVALLGYVGLCVYFGLILSDVCGEPWWYDRRVFPPKIEQDCL